MKRRYHFPFFFLLVTLLFACHSQGSDSAKDNYSRLVAKASGHLHQKQFDSAFACYNMARNEKSISADQRVYALISMAEIQRIFGDFAGAEATTTEALPFLPLTESDYRPSIYNLLGIVYKDQEDYANSLKYYSLSLALAPNMLAKAIVQNNIAVVNMSRGRFHTAIGSLTPLVRLSAVRQDKATYARILDNLGHCQAQVGNHSLARQLLEHSLDLRLALNDQYGLVATFFHLSEFYDKKNLAMAQVYARKALESAQAVNSADDRLEALSQLVHITDGASAKDYSLAYIRLADSLSNVRQSAKNQFAKIRYDDATAKKENAEMKNINILLAASGLLLIVSGIFVVLLVKARHKREKQQQVHKTEEAISKKIHDVLANDLYNAMTFAKTSDFQSEHKKDILLRHLNGIYLATRDIAHQTGEIETGHHYLTTMTEMLQLYNDRQTHITIKGLEDVPWDKIDAGIKRTVYRLIQELLVNMKKHSNASLVFFDFGMSDRKLIVSYKDNGVSFDGENDVLAKVLKNVENHIHTSNGRVTFDNVSGRVNIAIPLK